MQSLPSKAKDTAIKVSKQPSEGSAQETIEKARKALWRANEAAEMAIIYMRHDTPSRTVFLLEEFLAEARKIAAYLKEVKSGAGIE